MKIQFHRIDTNVVVGLLVREFCCSGTDVFAKVLAMYAGTRTPSMEPQWLAAGLSQMLAVVGRALVVVAGYMGSVPLMLAGIYSSCSIRTGTMAGRYECSYRILLGIHLSYTRKEN